MSRRTTIVLGVIALAMAAFIAFVESGMLSSGELAARRGRVLSSFVRPRVTDVEVRRGEERVVIHRDREEDLEAFEIGHWVLTAPVASDADQDAVDQLLSALEWLEARRSLTGITEEDRERFGLTSPAASVRFTVADRDVTVTVGGDDPRGEGVYVGVSDRPGEAFVVGRDFVEALEHDASHFRRKELFASVRSSEASAVDLRNAHGRARLAREEGRWWLREPSAALARTSAVESLFGALADLRATRFLAEDPEDLAEHGLDEPTRDVTIERERDDVDPPTEGAVEADRSPLRLRVGGPCPDHEGEVTAIAGEDGPVVCVEASALEVLDAELDRLRESRLVSMRDDELERATIEGGGAELQLRREESAWQVVRGDEARPGDAEAIADWMRLLRAQEATAYEPATAESLRARGLESPRATLHLHRGDEDRSETITLGAATSDGVWARRGEEPQLALFPTAAGELLAPAATRFRDRRLVRESEDGARHLRIVRDGVEETLEREGSEWHVSAPVEVRADRVVARDVARRLATLSAVRFVSDRAAPEHGLDRPRVVVTARFEGPPPGDGDEDDAAHDEHDHGEEDEPAEDAAPRDVVLRIGAATEGGSFARLGDDPAVLVVAPELAADLEGPLASRDLLATETSALESLAIVRSGERVELRRGDDGWLAGGAAADEARTTLVLDRLASLRAAGTTAYGPAPAAHGLDAPIVVLEVQRRTGDPERYELRVGAPGQPGDDGWYHARRTDLEIGYRLATPVVRALLDYQP